MATTNHAGRSRHTSAEKLAIIQLIDEQPRAAYRRLKKKTPRVAPGGKVAVCERLHLSFGVITKWRKMRDAGKLAATPEEIAEAKARLAA